MLISTWIPKGASLIRGRHLPEAHGLLEEMRYYEKPIFQNIYQWIQINK